INQIEIYPNPVRDILYLSTSMFKTPKPELKIYDITGKLQASYKIDNNGGTYSLSVKDLLTGSYILKITDERKVYHGKILVYR
ncbi:MAG: T9SS type A sorting domain-containing protein, partial [Spirochaetales bacterium]|nr:T9SS type A sorting domain-containing protein [Spirochaetales bacterium]